MNEPSIRDRAHEIEPGLFVASQLGTGDLAAAKDAGFRTIINNRPDGEGGAEQPRSAELKAEAQRCGLVYHHLPVSPAHHGDNDARTMVQIVAEAPRSVLAFCRTGRRSAALYAKGKTLR